MIITHPFKVTKRCQVFDGQPQPDSTPSGFCQRWVESDRDILVDTSSLLHTNLNVHSATGTGLVRFWPIYNEKLLRSFKYLLPLDPQSYKNFADRLSNRPFS